MCFYDFHSTDPSYSTPSRPARHGQQPPVGGSTGEEREFCSMEVCCAPGLCRSSAVHDCEFW